MTAPSKKAIEAGAEAIRSIIEAVPTNWTDPILTGPERITIPAKEPDIERLLREVRARVEAAVIAALASGEIVTREEHTERLHEIGATNAGLRAQLQAAQQEIERLRYSMSDRAALRHEMMIQAIQENEALQAKLNQAIEALTLIAAPGPGTVASNRARAALDELSQEIP